MNIPTITRNQWNHDYVRRCQPCLIVDGMSEWPAKSWTPEHLSAICGDRPVTVQVSHSGKWQVNGDGHPADPRSQYSVPNVPFRVAVDWIRTTPRQHKYYVSQLHLKEYPELVGDLRFTPPVEAGPPHLWFGSTHTVTPLHYDAFHNWFAQIYGGKIVNLYEPNDAQYFYLPRGAQTLHVSPIDVESPDKSKYPLFAEARPYQVHVEPGQILFIPAFWWHHVRSTGVSISANQWWRPELEECQGMSATIFYEHMYKHDGWCQIRANRRIDVETLLKAAEAWASTSNIELAALAIVVATDELMLRPQREGEPEPRLAKDVLVLLDTIKSAVLNGQTHALIGDEVLRATQLTRASLTEQRLTTAELT